MEGGGTWGGQRVGFRIDKIKSVTQLLLLSAPNGMKIGMDVAWVVGSLLETRFVWGREGDIRGTARFLQASGSYRILQQCHSALVLTEPLSNLRVQAPPGDQTKVTTSVLLYDTFK